MDKDQPFLCEPRVSTARGRRRNGPLERSSAQDARLPAWSQGTGPFDLAAELRDCLHLKTGATFAGKGVLLYNAEAIDPAQFSRVEPMAVEEPAAANCVLAGDRLILPAGNRRTAERLRNRGFAVVEVDVSELQKAEAGVTCMSLIDDRP